MHTTDEEKRLNGAIRARRFRDNKKLGLKEVKRLFATAEHEQLIRDFAEQLKNPQPKC